MSAASGAVTESGGAPSALAGVVDALVCPVCGAALALAADGRSLRCASGHGFDVARQGYVSLLRGGGNASTGDTADMVAARDALLGRGHYAPIADAVARAVARAVAQAVAQPVIEAVTPAVSSSDAAAHASRSRPGLVVDLAGGTGYYLERVLRAHPGLRGIDLDLSKFAARRAARRIEPGRTEPRRIEPGRTEPRRTEPSRIEPGRTEPNAVELAADGADPVLAAVVADVWQPLPLATGSADVVLSIFGPRNRPEILRVLRPGGCLVVVTPTPDHLRELVGPLGMIGVDERKRERLAAQLDGFTDLASTDVGYSVPMSHPDVLNDVLMGPSAHHLNADDLAPLVAALPEPVTVTVSVTVTTCFAPR